jgi:hypothetical protein
MGETSGRVLSMERVTLVQPGRHWWRRRSPKLITMATDSAVRGLANAEIGRELFISEATVKTHLLRACGKLAVTGRTAAVAPALDQGLLPPTPQTAPAGFCQIVV